jgi:hypothetical protein
VDFDGDGVKNIVRLRSLVSEVTPTRGRSGNGAPVDGDGVDA